MTLGNVLGSGFLLLLGSAAWFDLRVRRVPNVLVLSILAWAFAAVLAGVALAPSPWHALGGVFTGLLLWCPLWLLGLLGAGDVKFFAAASAWIGPVLAIKCAALAALLGGVLGVAMLLHQRGGAGLRMLVGHVIAAPGSAIGSADVRSASAAERTLPYAVPMAIALALAVLRSDLLRTMPFS